MLTVGHGDFRYQQDDTWPTLPEGWIMDHPSGIAVDSHDRVYVFNRNKHPMIVFEADTGEFVTSWGEGEFKEPHGIFIDDEDHVWTADRNDHTVVKYTRYGENLLELGTRGWANMTVTPQGTTLDPPFNMPAGVAIAEDGCIFVADGYGNRQVHRFSPEGELELSWGTSGTEPGQFALVHNIGIDSQGRVLVCDRANHRIQFFDREGQFIQIWNDVQAPGGVYCSPEGVIYVAEQGGGGSVSIFSEGGELICRFTGEKAGLRGVHSIWIDSRKNLFISELSHHGHCVQRYAKI